MHNLIKEFISELMGTAILMLFGTSGAACSVLNNAPTNLFTAFAYAFGVIIASAAFGPISGAHINPAVTLAFCSIKKCSWRKIPIYLLAQYLGSFIGCAITWGLYHESIQSFDKELTSDPHNLTVPTMTSAGIFITLPAAHVSIFPAISTEIVSTGLLVFAILFIGDETCFPSPKLLQILTTGLTILTFIIGFSYNTGAILNPARDVAPRVLLSLVGYHKMPFEPLNNNFWWAVGIVGPHLGAIIGAIFYQLIFKMRASYAEKLNTGGLDLFMPIHHSPNNVMHGGRNHHMMMGNPEQDLIYQKARIVINDNIKNLNSNSRY